MPKADLPPGGSDLPRFPSIYLLIYLPPYMIYLSPIRTATVIPVTKSVNMSPYFTISLYPYIPTSLYHYIPISLYPYIHISLYGSGFSLRFIPSLNRRISPYFTISLHPYCLISIYHYIPTSLYPYIHIALFPCIPISLCIC